MNNKDSKKSSPNCISGDGKISPKDKIHYTIQYYLEKFSNLSKSLNCDLDWYVPEFDTGRLIDTFGNYILTASPSRALCCDFLLHYAEKFLGNRPRLIDLGCGRGNYSQYLRELVDFASYNGVDIKQNAEWIQYESEHVEFSTAVLGQDYIDVGDATAVFSQSALEHVQFDKEIFRRLTSTKPVNLRHLHLVPATQTWHETHFHGYRRYGPVQLNSLLDNPDFSNIRVFALGNWLSRACYRLQMGKRLKLRTTKTQEMKALVTYDRRITPLENLASKREQLVASDISDVSFFAVTFDQKLA